MSIGQKIFLEVCDVAAELGIKDADVMRLISQSRLPASLVETTLRGRPRLDWKVKVNDLQAFVTGTVDDLQIPFGADAAKLFKSDPTAESKTKTAFREAASRATPDNQIIGEMKRVQLPHQSLNEVRTISLDFFGVPDGFLEVLSAPPASSFMVKSDPTLSLLALYLRSRIRRAAKKFLHEKYGRLSDPVASLYSSPEAYVEALKEAADAVAQEDVSASEIRILKVESGRTETATTVEIQYVTYQVTVNYSIGVSIFAKPIECLRVAGQLF